MPVSPVAGIAGSIRIKRLTATSFAAAEAHGKRLDAISQARRVRDVPPVTTTGLDLALLRHEHIQGYFRQSSTTRALHLLAQWPAELTDSSDADLMLSWSRRFAERVFGSGCVFADRVDRDETSQHVVDLFILPKYQKKTKRTEKPAISTTYHLKKLALEYGWQGDGPPLQREQGIALQSAWFEFLRDEVGIYGVQRGSPKKQPGDDWLSPEELALVRDRERLEADRQRVQAAFADAHQLEESAQKVLEEAEHQKAKAQAELKVAIEAKRQADQERDAAFRLQIIANKTLSDARAKLAEATGDREAAVQERRAAAADRSAAAAERDVAVMEHERLQRERALEKRRAAETEARTKLAEEAAAKSRSLINSERAAAEQARANAEAEVERQRRLAAAAELERQKAAAFAIGVEAFVRGEIVRAVVDPDGRAKVIFKSEADRANLVAKLRPAWDALVSWLVRMTKTIEARLEARIEALVERRRQEVEKSVTPIDIEEAAKRMVTRDEPSVR